MKRAGVLAKARNSGLAGCPRPSARPGQLGLASPSPPRQRSGSPSSPEPLGQLEGDHVSHTLQLLGLLPDPPA